MLIGGSKKSTFFLKMVKKKTSFLMLMKKLCNKLRTKEKNRFF